MISRRFRAKKLIGIIVANYIISFVICVVNEDVSCVGWEVEGNLPTVHTDISKPLPDTSLPSGCPKTMEDIMNFDLWAGGSREQ